MAVTTRPSLHACHYMPVTTYLSFHACHFMPVISYMSLNPIIERRQIGYIDTSWISATSTVPSPMIGQAFASATACSMLSVWMMV